MEVLLKSKPNPQAESGSANKQDSNNSTYINHVFDVPPSFLFPKMCNLSLAWSYWIKGLQLSYGTNIKPFRFLEKLPKKIRDKYRTEFRPVLELLEEGVALNYESGIPSDYERLTIGEIQTLFNAGYNYLKDRMSFIFIDSSENGASQRASWSVGYCSKLIKPSSVEKYGTASDKRYLLSETEYFGRKNKQRRRSYFFLLIFPSKIFCFT